MTSWGPTPSFFLEAHNDKLNHHRFYHIEVSKNLFGLWSVETRYGRINARGQSRLYILDTFDEVKALVQKSLKKRMSAQNRIGCPYTLKHIDIAGSWTIKDWFPPSSSLALLKT